MNSPKSLPAPAVAQELPARKKPSFYPDVFRAQVEGREPVLVTEDGEYPLRPGMCAGFPAGSTAHQLVNRGEADVVYLEVGDRTAGDEVTYPQDDLAAVQGADGRWIFTRKDGTPY